MSEIQGHARAAYLVNTYVESGLSGVYGVMPRQSDTEDLFKYAAYLKAEVTRLGGTLLEPTGPVEATNPESARAYNADAFVGDVDGDELDDELEDDEDEDGLDDEDEDGLDDEDLISGELGDDAGNLDVTGKIPFVAVLRDGSANPVIFADDLVDATIAGAEAFAENLLRIEPADEVIVTL